MCPFPLERESRVVLDVLELLERLGEVLGHGGLVLGAERGQLRELDILEVLCVLGVIAICTAVFQVGVLWMIVEEMR